MTGREILTALWASEWKRPFDNLQVVKPAVKQVVKRPVKPETGRQNKQAMNRLMKPGNKWVE
ncbi:hypothetical protein CH330_08090 [candidate division WOR-3 bacterium JGI_Cruoil_03_51_56]|uniref:Uncharacterized protein n=1 Tax=candidate division WOR-3 bacterium JGI_Cruoil_03_51_56 TaxID=1973747 RepID=A0A235BQ56_UNCW3|nr:MAG: hypothetical protein CH330_08090 [candidate division WOR-3 bacterium JGI_Cruoil_03_51_56]